MFPCERSGKLDRFVLFLRIWKHNFGYYVAISIEQLNGWNRIICWGVYWLLCQVEVPLLMYLPGNSTAWAQPWRLKKYRNDMWFPELLALLSLSLITARYHSTFYCHSSPKVAKQLLFPLWKISWMEILPDRWGHSEIRHPYVVWQGFSPPSSWILTSTWFIKIHFL